MATAPLTPASGVNKLVSCKREATYGTKPSASGAQAMRRVTLTGGKKKTTFKSNEINSHRQLSYSKHGVISVNRSLSGELAPGSYSDFLSSILRRDMTAGASAAGVSLTIAASGAGWSITRAAGSYLTDGFKVGDVVRLAGAGLSASNAAKNVQLVSVTATVATGYVLNGSALVAEGPIASCTVTVQGKKTYAPTTGHTDVSYSIEQWHPDITKSETDVGVKIGKASIGMKPNGVTTISFDAVGRDIETATSQYFTSPTAAVGTEGVNVLSGVVCVNGAPIATLTNLSVSIDPSTAPGEATLGSRYSPFIFRGKTLVDGTMSFYFVDASIRDLFDNETAVDLFFTWASSNDAAADFVAFTMPNVKINGDDRDDGEKGVIVTAPFTAAYNSTGGAGVKHEQTTISYQDSAA